MTDRISNYRQKIIPSISLGVNCVKYFYSTWSSNHCVRKYTNS